MRMGKLVSDTIGGEDYLIARGAAAERNFLLIPSVLAPVTSVVVSPTAPKDSLLVASLDSTIRLMDRTNGQVRDSRLTEAFVL